MKDKHIWIGVGAVVVLLMVGIVFVNSSGPAGMPGTVASTTETGTPTGQQATGGRPATGGTQTGTPGSQATPGALKMHVSTYGFSVQYPSPIIAETSGLGTGSFATQGSVGAAAFTSSIGTVADRLLITVSSEPRDLGECAKTTTQTSTATINGVVFVTSKSSKEEGGNYTDTTVYQTVHNQTCFDIRESVTYATNARLTATEAEQQRLNMQASAALMSTIINSFKFTR